MLVVIIIAAIVLALSLVEFYSTRSWQQVTSDNRNDLVFEGRNKAYGAYKIRQDYNKTFLLVILACILSVAILNGGYMLSQMWKPVEEVKEEGPEIEMEVFEAPDEEIEEPEVLPDISQDDPLPMEVTKEFNEIVAVDKKVEQVIVTQDDLKDTKASSIENKNGIDTWTVAPTDPMKTVSAGGTGTAPKNDIETFVDEEAGFPGGKAKLNKFLGDNLRYPPIAEENGIQGKVTVKFVVSLDGSISDVNVLRGVKGCKECDAEAVRVIKKMPAWVPAKKNGVSVKAYFTMPITFQLQ